MALGRVLINNGNEVTIWTRHTEKLDVYARDRVFAGLCNMPIPKALAFEKDPTLLVKDKDILIVAVPSIYVRKTISPVAGFISCDQIIISVTKGIEKDSLLLPTEVIADELKNIRGHNFHSKIVALSGPSHAEEVARDLPTTMVSSSNDPLAMSFIQKVFTDTCIRVYTNPDTKGVELCGALKNIIALASGVCEGLGYGDNTKAAIITRGLAEITRLGLLMGCTAQTFAGLAGMGDLVVTCTSRYSRNNRCGVLIGRGIAPKEAQKEIGMVVEGINTLPAAIQLMEKYDVEMPIICILDAVINRGMDRYKAADILMGRSMKDEIW